MKNIILQRATAKDVDVYLSLEQSVIGPKTYSGITDRNEVIEEIENNVVYLVKVDGIVVGSTEYQMKGKDEAYLSGGVMSPSFQGQGIPKIVFKKILKELMSVKRIYLVTHPHNIPILRLALSFCFIVEAWKDDYFGDGEPRLILSRTHTKI